MKVIIDKILADAPDDAAEMQVMLDNQYMVAGAVKHCDVGDGIYEMLVLGKMGDGTPVMTKQYFRGSEVKIVMQPVKEDSRIVVPDGNNGVRIPGRS